MIQISLLSRLRGLLLTAGILLILTVTCSTAQQSAVVFTDPSPDVLEEQSEPYRSEFFRVDHSPNITVNTITGDIDVLQNPGIDGVQVDLFVKREFSLWSGSRSLDNYRIIIQKQGNTIIASVEDRRTGRSVRSGADVQFSFRVQVPREASLNLRSVKGKINADGVKGQHYIQNHAGSLNINRLEGEIRTVSTVGDINLLNLTGNIFAKTVSGNIVADQNIGEVRVRTTTGNIEATGISGTLIAASTSGDIRSDFKEVSVGVYLESVTGDIDLILPKNAGYDIDAKGLTFHFDSLNERDVTKHVGFRDATVEIREGGIPVNLKTVSGSISVREN